MITKEYGMEELARARALQQEAIKLHLPCPPVVHWSAEIIDENGIVEERRKGKCNSYTRNGLNLIATAGMCLPTNIVSTSVFGDGKISYKDANGNMPNGGSYYWLGYANKDSNSQPGIIYGNGTAAESLDRYVLSSKITGGTQTTMLGAYFDADNRKLISVLSGTLENTTSADLSVTETGIVVTLQNYNVQNANGILTVRDLLAEAITVPAGKTLNFNYTFELAYPEP